MNTKNGQEANQDLDEHALQAKKNLEILLKDRSKQYNKIHSRTFWLAVIWTAFVPLSIICQVIITGMGMKAELPIASIVSFAGGVTTIYIGGNKVYGVVKESQETKKRSAEHEH